MKSKKYLFWKFLYNWTGARFFWEQYVWREKINPDLGSAYEFLNRKPPFFTWVIATALFTIYGFLVGTQSLDQAISDSGRNIIESRYGALIELYGSDPAGKVSALKQLPSVTEGKIDGEKSYKEMISRVTMHMNDWLDQYDALNLKIENFDLDTINVHGQELFFDDGSFKRLQIGSGVYKNLLVLNSTIDELALGAIRAREVKFGNSKVKSAKFDGAFFCYSCNFPIIEELEINNKLIFVGGILDPAFKDREKVFYYDVKFGNQKCSNISTEELVTLLSLRSSRNYSLDNIDATINQRITKKFLEDIETAIERQSFRSAVSTCQ